MVWQYAGTVTVYAPVYPSPSQVATGVQYGPNGNDRTGELTGGSVDYEAIAAAVRVELTTELDRIDAKVSSRSTLTAAQVWAATTRTLTAAADSTGVTTLLSRITGLLRTKSEADATDSTLLAAIEDAQEAITDVQTDVSDLQSRPAFDPLRDTVAVDSGSVEAIRGGLATAEELAKVIKSGEPQTITRSGKDSVTYTATRGS